MLQKLAAFLSALNTIFPRCGRACKIGGPGPYTVARELVSLAPASVASALYKEDAVSFCIVGNALSKYSSTIRGTFTLVRTAPNPTWEQTHVKHSLDTSIAEA